MTDLSEEIDTAIGLAVTGLRALRLLLGRHRHPARHHPPGRPATLGPVGMTTRPRPPLSAPNLSMARGWGRPPTTPRPSPGPTSRAWERQLATTGICSHPIRLTGRIDAIDRATGETAPVYDTAARARGRAARRVRQPPRDRLPRLLGQSTSATPGSSSARAWSAARACPSRSARTRACSPPSPRPSFGPVHSRRMRGKTVLPCRPRRDASKPAAARTAATSPARPGTSKTIPGLAGRCAPTATTTKPPSCSTPHAGDLWRRFTTYLPRHLARLAGVTQKELRSVLRIRYVKVAEYQARGVVHFHAVIRLDATRRGLPAAPGPLCTAALLCDAIGQAATRRHASTVPGSGPRVRLGFGRRNRRAGPIRHGSRPARHRPSADRPGSGQLHRQVRHQGRDVPGLPDARIRTALEHRRAALLRRTTGA